MLRALCTDIEQIFYAARFANFRKPPKGPSPRMWTNVLWIYNYKSAFFGKKFLCNWRIWKKT